MPSTRRAGGPGRLLVHPDRQVERVPRLIPGAQAEIISRTGHGPQIDHAELTNRKMLDFMNATDLGLPTSR
ncbi:alpha/beta fold hydrolase [Streptomyces sp. NBC_00647]|uniref:alpha/beta fold hydrolase n=1 Tax=Streptomyces sp. NBC_00647 TaxID=2975796 RepID=UPI003864BDF9